MVSKLLLMALVGAVVIAALRLPEGPPPAYAIDCSNYLNQHLAQLALRLNPDDPNGLDGPNDDGIACEGLACPCDPEPVEEAIGDADDPASPAATSSNGASASAGAVTANASASTSGPFPTSTPEVAATVVAIPPTSTLVPAVPSLITPPSTGEGGLK